MLTNVITMGLNPAQRFRIDRTMPLDGLTMHSDALTTFTKRFTMRLEMVTVLGGNCHNEA
jgi:hypothetical protein